MKNQIQQNFCGVDKSSLFMKMSDLEINEATVALHGMVRKFSKSDYINFPGDCFKKIAIVLSGTINIIAENVLGRNAIISSLNRGSVISGRLFGDSKNSVEISYLAVSDSEILVLPIENLQDLSADSGALAKLFYNICIMMADDSMRLVEKIDILNQRYLRDKIMAYLRMQAIKQHSTKLEIPFNRTQLADYLNADRSSMTKELYLMKEEGLIDFERNIFEIKFDI